MKKSFTLLLALLGMGAPAVAQCPTNLTLTTQAQVNNFPVQYPNCSILSGSIFVQSGDGITNLNALSNLIYVSGDVYIGNNNKLTSLNGLQNITGIGHNLDVINNATLTSLSGLNGLTSVVNNVTIDNNVNITALDGLNGLTSIGGFMALTNNSKLQNTGALSSLTSISGSLTVFQNNTLANLDGFGNLQTLGGLVVTTNSALAKCANGGICNYLLKPGAFGTFGGNKTGCNSVFEVLDDCLMLDVSAPATRSLKLSPNPAGEWIRIEGFEDPGGELVVFDAQGQQVVFRQVQNGQLVSIADLKPGFYTVLARSDERLFRGVFVKE